MYLDCLQIKNFRRLKDFSVHFNDGLNLLVGENDCGKSSIIDAIKLVTGTQSNDWYRLTKEDFYTDGSSRAEELKITCIFKGMNADEIAAFLEWTSLDKDEYYLKLTLTAKRKETGNLTSEIFYDIKAGEDEESGVITGEAKNKLRVTYLKPLRDAEFELAPRKGSRLSQILAAYDIFQSNNNDSHPLVETMNRANAEITEYFSNKDGRVVSDTINTTYLKELSLLNNPITSKFGIAKSDLGKILEKLELHGFSVATDTNLGLGSNNLLFIAAEMLLLKRSAGYVGLKLSLIEEIEAHIHPQSQINLIDFLNKHSNKLGFQKIISTHSNSLASKVDLKNIIICKNGKAYSLKPEYTKLASGDYGFLGRFLDDTKANLFFAHGVILVEGDAENLVIPTFAEYIGYPLHKYGISVVNVGSTALLRYSKIFQRSDGLQIGIKVACLSDRDIPPKEAKQFVYQIKRRVTGVTDDVPLIPDSRKTEDEFSGGDIDRIIRKKIDIFRGGDVEVFIGNTWTFEFELAKSVLRDLLHTSIEIARFIKDEEKDFTPWDYKAIKQRCDKDVFLWKNAGKSDVEIAVNIYSSLERDLASKAVTAQIFAKLLKRSRKKVTEIMCDSNLQYIIGAIKHAANV
jgi:putative ATP-dependent endonuclease of the OLD family